MTCSPRSGVLLLVVSLVLAPAAGCDGTTEAPPDSPRPTTVVVTPASVFIGVLGATRQLSAEVSDQHGNSMAWDSIAWSSSDRSVATVTRTGLVTALGEGGATITARAGDAEGTAEVRVENLERTALVALYEAADGPNWVNNDGWLTDSPLRDWYGVETNATGHVTRLELAGRFDDDAGEVVRHGLAGPIPAELANLPFLWSLDLSANELTGPIPPELGDLPLLYRLHLSGNELTGPLPGALSRLPNLRVMDLSANRLSGLIPEEFGTFRVLTILDLSHNRLTGPIQRALGNLRLTTLYLNDNELTGPIPDQLGFSEDLEWLIASNNKLTGPIPPELGQIRNLSILSLDNNALSGPIPGELGRADSLRRLILERNDLSGPIPPELGDLSDLAVLELGDNMLSGSIPPELGNLTDLATLELNGNALSGSIPPELGKLGSLRHLYLDHNDLDGPVPTEFGGLFSLRDLMLANNPRMAGSLPGELAGLFVQLLVAGGTGLCAPPDSAFQTWLEGVPKRRIATCSTGGPPQAYLTQAVQSREFPVPLVAGESALLRVFPTAREATEEGIPPVRARLFLDGREILVEDLAGKSAHIPTEVVEGDLALSANVVIDGSLVQPGLEMVIEVDPDGTVAPELGVQRRIPEAGRLPVEVRELPVFDLTLLPFLWSEDPDSAIVGVINGMAADPENHEMIWGTRTLLPVRDLEVTAHDPVLTSTNNTNTLLRETRAIWTMEGGTGYYRGMMSGPVTGTAEVAYAPGRVSFGQLGASVMEHGLGHNLNLRHAPCGDAGYPDRTFPYPGGSIGAWGYDFRDGGRLVRPSSPDLMSYCESWWVSDYHFTNALRFRLSDAAASGLTRSGSPSRGLLLWGGIDDRGAPTLEPVFLMDAPAVLPDSAGDHELVGRTASDRVLFSLRFAMPVVADGDGSSSFAYVLPVQSGWEKDLASVTLSGPGGTITVDRDSDLAMAILRSPSTGQVRGVLRDLSEIGPGRGNAVGATQGLDLLFSRGIPAPEAWRR